MKTYENQPHFTRDERQGLYFLIACISLLIFGISIFNSFTFNGPVEFSPTQYAMLASFNPMSTSNTQASTPPSTNKPRKSSLFPFDPNTLSLDSLEQLPISKKVAKIIDNYRSKGGKFKDADDLKKIYGIEKYYDEIEPYINIKVKTQEQKNKPNLNAKEAIKGGENYADKTPAVPKSDIDSKDMKEDESMASSTPTTALKKDSTFSYADYKDEEDDLVLDLNSANEYELQMINGIGEYYAKKIVAYRDKIGGFYCVDQLAEAVRREDALAKMLPHFTCDASLIKRRNINSIQADTLAFIPGVGYKKSKIAIRYIENHYPLTSRDDLERIRIFSEEDIDLMMLYLAFE